jgi:hypothetical protein
VALPGVSVSSMLRLSAASQSGRAATAAQRRGDAPVSRSAAAPDRRRGAIGGAQEQRDADEAVVCCARPALCWRPCLATSIPDPPLLAAA